MTILNDIGHVENPSARIQFLQVAQTTPGQCGICGKGQDKRGFADTQLDFEYWGRLILCADCALQIGQVFGHISPAEYEELLGERDLAILQLHEANDQIEALRKVVDGLNLLGHYSAPTVISTGDLSSLEATPGAIIPTKEPEQIKSGSIPEPSDLDKSDAKQRGTSGKSSDKPGLLNI